ncbi:bifunctional hydroxymethylpyrimidine kinase/phosphomethylpyrimidine kinase [Corynebacterium hylobatis]|uniref:Thiamine biosynthesis multifunctional protein ThiED n=1 Tax=Corynebacterium hylobatis TaxID=1859290 RepID=A0A3R9ZE80_9CORY|nr:bifunctional hydroxymethylpyrimidine kinase/phosphomethylpyrimidine kinase [Corynebacterium hylobatis]RSZ63446.1 bifunctional hydroxymethylpyrimidine kinase/phosphomethylpyrimidine kinase [Corynebacterium hylobatis]
MTQPRVLSIAGTDPTGGAGIQADLKSIAAAGGFGMAAVTALVAQNTHGVRSVHTPPHDFLREQLAAVFDDVTVDAVKIGMLGDAATVAVVTEALAAREVGQVVLDPVMVASSGDRLLEPDAEAAVRELARRVDVITPNLRELAVLCDTEMAVDLDEAITQATGLAAETETVVIVKGGHLTGAAADNAVVHPDGAVHHVPTRRVDTKNTHGTGCSLSAALATRLAAGEPVAHALEWSTRWLHEAIRHADGLEVGGGHGPVDHFHRTHRLTAAADATPWPHLSGELPTIPAPVPHLAPAGPHTRAMWEATGQVWAEIMDLAFIRELREGTLRQRDFAFYLDQDAQYLNRYSRALALLSAGAPDQEGQIGWAESAREVLEGEAQLHRDWLGSQDITVTAPSPVTLAYTNFLVASCAVEPYAVGAAAVLPCFWLYAEIGFELMRDNHEGHPYRAWLETYGGEEFTAGARAAIARTERALAAASPEEREQAMAAYLNACIYEREFFAQADRTW